MALTKQLIIYNLQLLQTANIEVKDIPKVSELVLALRALIAPVVESKEERGTEIPKEEKKLKELFD